MLRNEVLALMEALKLRGMQEVYDEVLSSGRKQRAIPEKVILELLKAEAAERRLRSIRYRLGQARFPMIKDLDSFRFAEAPSMKPRSAPCTREAFSKTHSNLIFVGGTGTGKTHLAIAIAANLVRQGSRARFYNLVDLANELEQENLAGRGGRLSASLSRFNLVVLDELGYLPFSKNASQLLFHLISKLYEQTSVIITTNLSLRGMAPGLRRQEDDHRHARSPHASLRDPRNRKRLVEDEAPFLLNRLLRSDFSENF